MAVVYSEEDHVGAAAKSPAAAATSGMDSGEMIGELIAGKYRVAQVLGKGSMGLVLAATHEGLGQRVAIKILHADDVENARRFDLEARVLARLRSDHVVRTFDVGTLADGRKYMVMEHLDGVDLGTLIERTALLPIDAAIDYVLQACEGIADVHAQGIVHRDLKPRNLFLAKTVDGRPLVKVLDFGVSKHAAAATASADMRLTQTTELLGSPSYMSPEQLVSTRNADQRTDIWALGVILYELLTRDIPFKANTITELAIVVERDQEIPAHELRPDVPVGLSRVIGRCLAKRPDDRFASVVELVDALVPYAADPSVATRVRGVLTESGRALPTAAAAPPAPTPRHSAPTFAKTNEPVSMANAASAPVATSTHASRPRAVIVGLASIPLLLLLLLVGGAVAWRARGSTQPTTTVGTSETAKKPAAPTSAETTPPPAVASEVPSAAVVTAASSSPTRHPTTTTPTTRTTAARGSHAPNAPTGSVPLYGRE